MNAAFPSVITDLTVGRVLRGNLAKSGQQQRRDKHEEQAKHKLCDNCAEIGAFSPFGPFASPTFSLGGHGANPTRLRQSFVRVFNL
jgi:hypothetical protein